MTEPTKQARPESLCSRTEWIFAGFIALEVLAFAGFPGLPLVVAGMAMATRLRESRKRTLVLWIIAGVLTIVALAPFILGMLGLSSFAEVDTTYG
ncbi:hypothetical protein [Arthrobacter gengyunqii]|uniref:DUF4190 domain-containing protein n=1 Tax=Arthrobacter gengyunqii TaxID=2886940 RepID=A0ABS8GLG4_9MICC|nr:hypothetical protein [Arthrobacter gengyunqii]MCC3267291.1 hypothetical protein [Arthrobacter gengyunqii]